MTQDRRCAFFCQSFVWLAVLLVAFPAIAQDEEKILNVYNWSDYITENVIEGFETEFGIKINYDLYDSSEIVDAKLLAGKTGYDVVLHDSFFVSRLMPIDIFLPLDRSQLPLWKNLDPDVLEALAIYDKGNKLMLPYMWGTTGFAYNVDMMEERIPDGPLNSSALVFDPDIISKIADCGVTFLDSPTDVIPMAMIYLGYEEDSADEKELAHVEEVLMAVRPYIRYFSSTRMIQDLPAKEVCVAMSWSGDYAQAQERAEEAGIDIRLSYSIPQEGSPAWVDGLVIPRDAPHPQNAHLFLNYLMRPKVIAEISNYIFYANGNKASEPYVRPEMLADPAIYPPPQNRESLFVKTALEPKLERLRTRLWARFKTGI